MNKRLIKNKKNVMIISVILIIIFLIIHFSFSERAIFFKYFILEKILGIYQNQLPYVR